MALGEISIGIMFVVVGFIFYSIIWVIGMVDTYNAAKTQIMHY